MGREKGKKSLREAMKRLDEQLRYEVEGCVDTLPWPLTPLDPPDRAASAQAAKN
ncbi:MAG: hypothetical protein ABIK79_16855 [Chloroflexota bacterium]|nr:hypothetical protein [Anaerolineae bacterium]